MSKTLDKPLINIKAACRLLGMSRYRFGRLIEKGIVKPAAEGTTLFRRREIEQLLGEVEHVDAP